MSEHGRDRLSDHVRVDLSDARVDRLWARVSSQLSPGRPSATRWLGVGAAAVVAAGVVLIVVKLRSGQEQSPALAGAELRQGAELEAAAEPVTATFSDGSKVEVQPSSRVSVGAHTRSAITLVLARGRIACDVAHRPERVFVVAAGGFEVRVVGTRFSVANEGQRGPTRVAVHVDRGVVEVRAKDVGGAVGAQVVRLAAGQSWTGVARDGLEPAAAPMPEPSTGTNEPNTAASRGSFGADRVVPQRLAGPAAVASGPSNRPSAQTSAAPAQAAPRSVAPAPSPGAAVAPTPASPAARDLFERGRRHWRAGRLADAARAYDDLLRAHPRDPRAGLAALELGRLRMDRLGDLRGAVQALERAVELAPGPELREDALARLVAATKASGNADRCTRARDRYLSEYPTGVHRRTVDATSCR